MTNTPRHVIINYMKQPKLTARQLLRLAVDATGQPDYQAAQRCWIYPSLFSMILNGRTVPNEAQRLAIAKAFPTVPVDAWGAK